MAYDHGLREVPFTTTGGNPYLNFGASGVRGRAVFGYAKHVVRAAAVVGTVTKAQGSVVISLRTSATAGGAIAATGTQIDTITLGTGNGRGKAYYVKGLNTVVSAGSEVQLIVTSEVTLVFGRGFLYVESAPADPANNTKMVESA